MLAAHGVMYLLASLGRGKLNDAIFLVWSGSIAESSPPEAGPWNDTKTGKQNTIYILRHIFLYLLSFFGKKPSKNNVFSKDILKYSP